MPTLKFKMIEDSKQKPEVRDQMSEVRVKLISDLRLLTSVMDGFNDFNGFYDFSEGL